MVSLNGTPLPLAHRIGTSPNGTLPVPHRIGASPNGIPLHVAHRIGGWLPKNHVVLHRYVSRVMQKASVASTSFAPCIVALQQLIEDRQNHLEIWIGFHQMFDEIPNKPPYDKNSVQTAPQIRHYMDMLRAFNTILTLPPAFEDNDLVAFPLTAVLDWPMGTAAGYSMFLNKDVNEKLINILNTYAQFLTTEKSRSVLIPHEGYLADFDGGIMFYDVYQVPDRNALHYGFASFDAWFTRQFNTIERWRPIANPDDNSVIVSACDSQVMRIQSAKQHDSFWLKGQPYSIRDMLHDDALAAEFGNGFVYQAFLSAAKYHRWNCPITGTIRKVVRVAGYPYVESYYQGFANVNTTGVPDPDPIGPERSQPFLTSVATRGLIFIDAADPRIGLMCVIVVGMSEVSSCDVHAKWQPGVPIKKGDELGTFHFGGSTHCLVFREGVNIGFSVNIDDHVNINSKIGKVTS